MSNREALGKACKLYILKMYVNKPKSKTMRTYCISNNLLLLAVLFKCFSIVWANASPLSASPNCSSVIPVFENHGISKADALKTPINGKNLRYCQSTNALTCCSSGMEVKAMSSLRVQLEKTVKESIAKLSSVLGLRATKFNEFFEQLLAESKREFHIMFKKTYGVLYEQNSYVFSDFFTELEKYYLRGKVDLAEAIDSFFNTLYQKMFTVLNAQYSFNDKYLGCVSEHMKELKPFGDVPDKLSVQIKRSFVATRTFAQALMTAAEISKKVMSIRPGENCTNALVRMRFCGSCKGYSEKPCTSYCENILKYCLHYYTELDIEWDNFVSSMEKVSERLLGPFNIVVVVEPINIKISEAIMNFQETGQDISNQVFQGCGQPVLGRRQRRASTTFVKYLKYNFKNKTKFDLFDFRDKINKNNRIMRSVDKGKEIQYIPVHSSNQSEQSELKKKRSKKKLAHRKVSQEDDTSKEPVLNKLVKDVRQKVKDSKKFWTNLPYQICNNDGFAASPKLDIHCWNGDTVDRYISPANSDHTINYGFSILPINSRQSNIVRNQLYYLKTAINHLRSAYNGLDVEWSDQDEPYYGSGSGSGDGIDGEIGSGLGSSDEIESHVPSNIDIPSVRGNSPTGTNIYNVTGAKYTPSDREVKSTANFSASSEMSLRKALITYLFPIYMAWFGGIISNFL